MRRSKAEAEATRNSLLDAALMLMLDKGFGNTSVAEICTAAGVTKGSFFHHFESKEELGKAVVYHYWHPIKQMMEIAPFQQIEDPLRRIYAYCDFISTLTESPQTPNSCLFGNFSQELSTTHPEICGVVAKGFSWWVDTIQADLEAAKNQYKPGVDFDTRSIAEHFVVIFEGAMILAKAQQNMSIVRKNIDHFKHYLAMLFSITHEQLTQGHKDAG